MTSQTILKSKDPDAAGKISRVGKPKTGPSSIMRQESSVPDQAGSQRVTKQELVLTLLNRKEGASIDEIMQVTNWQQHSVRGFFAGTVKKKLGFDLTSSRQKGAARRYRIEPSRR